MWKRIPTASLPPQEQRESPATGRPPPRPEGVAGPPPRKLEKPFCFFAYPCAPPISPHPERLLRFAGCGGEGKSRRAPHFFCGERQLRKSARGSGKERGRKWGGEDAKRVFRGVMLPCDCFCGPPHLPARPRGSWAAANAIEGISPVATPPERPRSGGAKVVRHDRSDWGLRGFRPLAPGPRARSKRKKRSENGNEGVRKGWRLPGSERFFGMDANLVDQFLLSGVLPFRVLFPYQQPEADRCRAPCRKVLGPEPFLSRPEASQMLILGSYPRPPGARFSRSGAAALPCPWPGKCAVASRLGSRSGGDNSVAGGGGERFLFMTFFLRESRASRRRSHLWPSIGIEIFPDASRKTIRTRKATHIHTHTLPPPWTQRAEPGPPSLPVASAPLTS